MAREYISDLSTKGIERLQKEITKYQKDLEKSLDTAIKDLAKLGKKVAIQEGSKFSKNLVKGNVTYKKIKKYEYSVETTNPLLTLLECGTGLVGEQSGSKTAQILGYQYRIGSKIRVYTLHFNGQKGEYEGWFYYDKKLGKVRFTQGIPSRPFFSNTASFLHQVAPKYVAEKVRYLMNDNN